MPRSPTKQPSRDTEVGAPPPPAPPRSTAPTGSVNQEAARAFALQVAQLLADDKCEDVVLLDVRSVSHVTDFIVIGSGTSERQMRSVLSHAEDLGAERKFTAYRSSSDDRSTWLLADFVDVVVHVFEPNTRAHYDLEMLWGDAQRIDWQREAQPTRVSVSRRQTVS